MEVQNEKHAKVLHSIYDKSGKIQFQCKVKEMGSGYFDTNLHNHDELKIVRIMSGSCVWNINGIDYCVGEGDFLLMNRLDIRYIKAITSEEPLIVCQYCFYPIALIPNLNLANFFYLRSDRFENLFAEGSQQSKELSSDFTAIYEEINEERPYRDEMILNLLSHMILKLSRMFASACSGRQSISQIELVSVTVDYINENPSANLTLPVLAARSNVSPAYFSRMFKAYTGVGLREYVTRSRVIHFITLMKSNPGRNIIDLAFASGFNTSSGFYKAFEKVTGDSPKAFARSEAQNADNR